MSSPAHFKKLSVVKLTNDFREGTAIIDAALPAEVPADKARLRVLYVGINASDINFTNGSYFKNAAPPFDCGFEALGRVEAVGAEVRHLSPGDHVVVTNYGCFAEYVDVPAQACIPVKDAAPEQVVLAVSATTAAVALAEVGGGAAKIRPGSVALVTAAAGGTGQIAVQLLKHVYQCTVIGTCSSEEKSIFLKGLGCDEVINYKTENLSERLRAVAPNGLDLVYECVGGDTFSTAVSHLAVHGQLIIIGAISGYKSGEKTTFRHPSGATLEMLLLTKSASLRGFFLPNHHAAIPQQVKNLLTYVAEGQVRLCVDKVAHTGLEGIADGVDHLYSGKSYGKVVVRIQEPLP